MPYAYIIVAYYAEALCLYYRVLCMCYRCLLSVYHSQNQGNKNSSGLILYSLLQHVDDKTFYKILQIVVTYSSTPPPHTHGRLVNAAVLEVLGPILHDGSVLTASS